MHSENRSERAWFADRRGAGDLGTGEVSSRPMPIGQVMSWVLARHGLAGERAGTAAVSQQNHEMVGAQADEEAAWFDRPSGVVFETLADGSTLASGRFAAA